MKFGEKLSKLRKERNYTQEQLAELIGVSRQTVSKWELDVAYPETEKLVELGKLFDCSMDYLLKESVTEKTNEAPSGFWAKCKEFCKRPKTKKVLKITGIVLLIFLAIDILSFLLYLLFVGLPH